MIQEKLKKLRLDKGWDQQKIASELGIEQSDYSKIETGKIKPDISKLIKFAKIYDIDFNELLGSSVVNNFNNSENSVNHNYGYINQLMLQENEIKLLKEDIKYLREQNQKLIDKFK
jgi:XRE family transcriptional regulator, regulator of sulfur utilization